MYNQSQLGGPQNKKLNQFVGDGNNKNDLQKNSQNQLNEIYQKMKKDKLIADPKQDELTQQYNDRLARKYQQIQEQNKDSRLIEPALLNEKALNGLVLDPKRVNALMEVLEQENDVLKGEVKSLSADLQKFMEWSEMLIEENRFMRDHINKKNRDIKNIIETIGLNESEKNHEQNHKNHILTEENNILVKHLEDLKEFKDEYQEYIRAKDKEIQDQQEINSELRQDFNEILEREENLSKNLMFYKSLYEDGVQTAKENERELGQKKEELDNLNLQLNDANSQLKLTRDNKNDIEVETKRTIQQLEQDNQDLVNKNRELEEQLNINNGNQDSIQKDLQQMKNENRLVKNKNQEIFIKHNQLLSELDIEKTKSDSYLKKVKELQTLSGMDRQELDNSNKKWEIQEKQLKNTIDLLKQELKNLNDRQDVNSRRMKETFQDKLNGLQDEQDNLQRAINNQNRLIERKDNQIAQIKEELEEEQARNAGISELEKQNEWLKQQLKEEKEYRQKVSDDKRQLQETHSKLQQQLQQQMVVNKNSMPVDKNEYQRMNNSTQNVPIYTAQTVQQQTISKPQVRMQPTQPSQQYYSIQENIQPSYIAQQSNLQPSYMVQQPQHVLQDAVQKRNMEPSYVMQQPQHILQEANQMSNMKPYNTMAYKPNIETPGAKLQNPLTQDFQQSGINNNPYR